jgi:formylglycine-generating enzyme required for sulfatase activity
MKKILFLAIPLIIIAFSYRLGDLSRFDLQSHSDAQQCLTGSPEMVLVQGGEFIMGAGSFYPEETPSISMKVDSFYMSPHEVTNAQFNEFVAATGYITVAERTPDPNEFPHLPEEQLVAGSAVFVKLSQAIDAGTFTNWWHFIKGANWRNPIGNESNIDGKDNYPVIHIAYEDAKAYANWKGHRLPTEAEYEYASRGGLDGAVYAYGSSLKKEGKFVANTWQGLFPFNDSAEDGHLGLAPVGCYAANPYGLYDIIGNVWEWTESTYYPRHIPVGDMQNNLPSEGYDPSQPGVPVGVIKGGSYLCADDFCMRYRPAARQAQDTGLGTSHIGFRTVKDI